MTPRKHSESGVEGSSQYLLLITVCVSLWWDTWSHLKQLLSCRCLQVLAV